ncbi:MAG: energy transducer TonB [Flavobacteriaceae bacterium]
MNFSKKNHSLVGQNEQSVKKPQKHDANLQKNSTLYFQVGLILTLLATYGLFEMQFMKTEIVFEKSNVPIEIEHYVNYVPEPKKEPIMEQKEPVRKKLLAANFKPIDDNKTLKFIEKDIITEPLSVPSNNVKIEDVIFDKPVETIDPIDFIAVEQVPIYPGCEGLSTREELKNCMSEKIGALVNKKFNPDVASDLGLVGKQNIYVQFTIDKAGNVTKIKARAPHNKLESEAIKVINKIPQMIPGKQRDQNVEVIYNLPIRLQVNH